MALTQVATSTNFTYWYQASLTDASVAEARAKYFHSSGFCETDLATLQSWFGLPGGFGPGNRIQAQIDRSGSLGTNKGYNSSDNPPMYIQVAPFDPGSSGQPVEAECRAVFAEELAEILMSYQAFKSGTTTWDSGHSQGEALSRVCGALLHSDGYYWVHSDGSLVVGPSIGDWLNASPRPNWIDAVKNTDEDSLSFGCGILFIYFLMYECDFTIDQIIAAPGITFAAKYKSLTGFTDAWDGFRATVQKWFPEGTTSKPASYAPSSDDILPHPGRGPGLAALGTTLYAAWKGQSGDDRLFFAHAPWKDGGTIPGNSSVSLSLASFTPHGASKPLLYAGYKGQPGDARVFIAKFDGNKWDTQQPIGSNSSIGPSLAAFNKKLYAAYKGEHADQRAFVISSDGNTWGTQKQIAGVTTNTGPALAAFAPAGGKERLYGAYKGKWADDGVSLISMDDQETWSGPESIPKVETSSSVSLAALKNVLYLVYKGKTSEDISITSSSDGKTWATPKPVSGAKSSVGPSLTAFDGKLYLAFKGSGTDPTINLLSSKDGNNWTSEPVLPGNTSPDLAGSGTNQ